ncbi:hypothetical protein K438DRAFT_1967520 [Mycena galopus ATCC 62051]|nr:hypothetical protein K438DRAFT_1967520 [Mycena galopus ATCC 62051]
MDGSSEMTPWTLLDNGMLVLSDRSNRVHWGTPTMAELGGASLTNPWVLNNHRALVLEGVIALFSSTRQQDNMGHIVGQGRQDTGQTGKPDEVEARSVCVCPSYLGGTHDSAETSAPRPAPRSPMLDAMRDFDVEVASGRLRFDTHTRIRTTRIQSNTRTLRRCPSLNNDENQAPRTTPRGLRRVTNSTSSAATQLVIHTAAEKARQFCD